ncbi:MAG: hypothetical protein AAGE84_21730 [Cyanobacteria bacterium P01_G01_bin.39]
MIVKIKITKISGAILCGILLVLGLKMITNQLNLDLSKKIAIDKHQANESIKGDIKIAKKFPLRLSDLETQAEDSERYLAYGDSGANRVVVYLRQADNSWLKSYEIHKPKRLIGKTIESDFGSGWILNNNILIVSSIIYRDFWGRKIDKRFIKRKTYSVLLGDKRPQRLKTIGSTPPYYYSHDPEFLGDNVALDVIDGENSHGEGDISSSNRYIYLINPRTGKKIKEVKLPNFGENRGHFRITMDSDGENLYVSPSRALPPTINSDDNNLTVSSSRRGGLQLEPLVLITKDGNLREIEFPIQYLDSISNRENAPLLYPNAIKKVAITNKLLAITVQVSTSDARLETIKTFWQIHPQPKLIRDEMQENI